MFECFKKRNILIAHRGYRAYYPENTIFAFEAAQKKFDMFEFDVQYTKDKVPVVFHDNDLLRCTNAKDIYKDRVYLKDFTYEEIKKLDNVSWFTNSNPFNVSLDYKKLKKLPKNSIPHLDEVLEFIKSSNFPANLEIKPSFLESKFIVDDILTRIEKFGVKDLILISSFNHEYIKEIDGFYKAALFDYKKENLVKYLKDLKVNAYHISFEYINEHYVKTLQEAGMFTNVYTVNDKKLQKELFKKGVKGVFCDL